MKKILETLGWACLALVFLPFYLLFEGWSALKRAFWNVFGWDR